MEKNDFLFSGVGKDNQKKALAKIQQEKEALKAAKEKEDRSHIIQRYLRGHIARKTLRRRLEDELTKNLGDLDKLSALVMQKKGEIFYLPLKNLWILMRSFYISRKMLTGKKRLDNVTILVGLAKWIQRGLETPDTNVLIALFSKEGDPL